MSDAYSEDVLVQKTTADYLHNMLGWESAYAYNSETYGPNGTLGRTDQRETVLRRYLEAALRRFNAGLPDVAYTLAIDVLTAASPSKSMVQINQEMYELCRDGVPVRYRAADGEEKDVRLRVFDFEEASNNHFLVVRELWIQGPLYRRRADIVGFVNGLPLLFMELKAVHRDIRLAYENNLSDYKETIPHLFHHNAFLILANGENGRVGTITGKYSYFNEWKRLAEDEAGVVDFETMLKGVCDRSNLMDLFENFILFDRSGAGTVKILARNHQFLGVNRAFVAAKEREVRDGKLGVFWHTQGSGKSYSMVLLTRKIHRKLAGTFTFLVLTDRQELDTQIYKTFAGVGEVSDTECRAASGAHLGQLLNENRRYIFSLVHKFNQDEDVQYSARSDIIVISDEAHRTQYGWFARNMRRALPNAAYIGFTGTPLIGSAEDELTKAVFGDYVSTYNFQRAVEDGATVPLVYDNRGEKLAVTTESINDEIAAVLDDFNLDEGQEEKVQRVLASGYHIYTAPERLDRIAEDLVAHYTERWQTGKAMLVCLDKPTAVKMHGLVDKYWKARIASQRQQVAAAEDEQDELEQRRYLAWLEETEYLVVVSEEQNEVKKFRDLGLDILPHRTAMKQRDLEEEFKDGEHRFRLAIVCAMWLTGFDVESLANMYIDKPMKSHTLMQSIARANRVYEGKHNGLIVDYNGMLKSLRQALATYAAGQGDGGVVDEPVRPPEELVADYAAAVAACVDYVAQLGFDLQALVETQGFVKIGLLRTAANAVSLNEMTQAKFEVLAREMFKLATALTGNREMVRYKGQHDAIDAIYKKVQSPPEVAEIGEVLAALREVVDRAIRVQPGERAPGADSGNTYDISQIDFDRLRAEFMRSEKQNTMVRTLKEQVAAQLARMVRENPLRMDYYARYREIVEEYNRETDRATVEKTFEALLNLMGDLSVEQARAVREGLSEEYLAVFDLLCQDKETLDTRTRNRVKGVAQALMEAIKVEIGRLADWQEKETTKAQVETFIFEYLWDEERGLPVEAYAVDEVEPLAHRLFLHVYQQYGAGGVYGAVG